MLSYFDVLLSLSFVSIAFGISLAEKLKLERDIIECTIRSFVQLVAVGYLLKFIFSENHFLWTSGMIIVMTLVGSYTSAGRAKGIPKPFPIALSAMFLSIIVSIIILLGLKIIPPKPMYLIPIAGMVIGNTMNTASITMIRVRDGILSNRDKIEAMLALGKSPKLSAASTIKSAMRLALIPRLDSVKVSGIIHLPGAMTGMILAGASPIQAVKFQIIIMYLIVGTPAIAAFVCGSLGYKRFFNSDEQLIINFAK